MEDTQKAVEILLKNGWQQKGAALLSPNSLANSTEIGYVAKYDKNILASEALYAFCGWLTTRKEKTVMSSADDASGVANLIHTFIEANGLKEPRDGWEENIKHPEDVQTP